MLTIIHKTVRHASGLLFLFLVACTGGVTPTAEIISLTPKNSEYNVRIESDIRAEFHAAPASEGDLQKINIKAEGSTMFISGAHRVDSNSLVFTPSKPLEYSTVYNCEILSGFRTEDGAELYSSMAWSFMTENDPLVGSWDFVSGQSYNGAYVIFHNSGVYDESNGTVFFSFAYAWTRESHDTIIIYRQTAAPVTVYVSFNEDRSVLTLTWNTYSGENSVTYKRR